MTPDAFRQLALDHAHARMTTRLGAVEFLIGEKVFAALGIDPALAIVKLSPQDQAKARAKAPHVFSPQPGGAGARGVTCVRLTLAREDDIKAVLAQAVAKARNARSGLARPD